MALLSVRPLSSRVMGAEGGDGPPNLGSATGDDVRLAARGNFFLRSSIHLVSSRATWAGLVTLLDLFSNCLRCWIVGFDFCFVLWGKSCPRGP